MVFLSGPRQVGKTTLAKAQLKGVHPGVNYFNWDLAGDRRVLSSQIFTGKMGLRGPDREIVVFDEIHKYPRWKNVLKGLFDANEPDTHWIITGSAALDVHRRGQDSLLGRSFLYHLFPLSVAELVAPRDSPHSPEVLSRMKFDRPADQVQEAFDALLRFGGFPEPFLRGEESFLKRWRNSRLERVINQDLAKTEHLKNLPLLENLLFLMPERVGKPLSINSLREDLEVHHATAKHWIDLLERVFYGFSVRPFSSRLSRMLKKEPKWYLWDWSEIEDAGTRFENMVAVHLMKFVSFINDTGAGNLSLHYIRDKEKREVDFLICEKRKPLMLLECKSSDATPHEPLEKFARELKVNRALQLVCQPMDVSVANTGRGSIDVISAAAFLSCLV